MGPRSNYSQLEGLHLEKPEAIPVSWKDSLGRQKQLQLADELHLGGKVRKENVLKEVY